MPTELRFCRNCGFRLGEGSAEYTETVRFQNVPPGTLPGNGAAQFQHTSIAGWQFPPSGPMRKRKKRMSGMSWMFIVLIDFFRCGGRVHGDSPADSAGCEHPVWLETSRAPMPA